ncbi:hypothetical protein [Haladaptatus sp. DJG-WS-42]|uniref:hypothetical protein n=1 Tax=Haladaptatus sp. DJG-WS-42 TaxID=3120516 RepID=UPI0030D2CE80
MNRRHLLATVAGASALPLAGCLGSNDLDWKRLPNEDGAALTFFDNGERTATVSATERHFDPENGRFGLWLNIWHREGTHLDSFRYEILAPSTPNGPRVVVSLDRPEASPWPEMTFGRGAQAERTIIDVPEVGPVGRGSLGIELRLQADRMPEALPVRIRTQFSLSHENRLFKTSTGEGFLELELPRNPNAQS